MATKLRSRSKKPVVKRRVIGLVVVIVAAGALWAGIVHWHATHEKVAVSSAIIRSPSPQPVVNSTTKTPSASTGISQGIATDNNGISIPTTNSQQWAISQSGAITVKEPVSNASLKPGDLIAGSATVSQIQYRLVDNEVGQIAEGSINVVNGNFSATIQFTPHASTGVLDVFSYDPNNAGAEINEVQIPVNF